MASGLQKFKRVFSPLFSQGFQTESFRITLVPAHAYEGYIQHSTHPLRTLLTLPTHAPSSPPPPLPMPPSLDVRRRYLDTPATTALLPPHPTVLCSLRPSLCCAALIPLGDHLLSHHLNTNASPHLLRFNGLCRHELVSSLPRTCNSRKHMLRTCERVCACVWPRCRCLIRLLLLGRCHLLLQHASVL